MMNICGDKCRCISSRLTGVVNMIFASDKPWPEKLRVIISGALCIGYTTDFLDVIDLGALVSGYNPRVFKDVKMATCVLDNIDTGSPAKKVWRWVYFPDNCENLFVNEHFNRIASEVIDSSVRRSSWLDRKFHWNWTGHNHKRPDHQLRLPWFRKFLVAGFKVWRKLGRPMKTGCNRSFTYIRNTPRTQKICTINFLGYKIVYITKLWLWVAIIIHYQTEWTV